MARNLPVAFAAIIGGGVLADAAIKGAAIGDVIKGQATYTAPPSGGSSGAGSAGGGGSGSTSGAAATPTKGAYVNPLKNVTTWERTDQGVDASMPAGAPILAPGKIKILGIKPDWYSGQPFIYWQLLDGPDAGKVQYVAEQITNLAQPGTILQAGQPIARFASSGTGIEFGWATASGSTLADATTGYTEGEITNAGRSMRQWLNSLGANAGPNT